jgi:Hexapeptide repeat of succinyl-transferase
MAIDAPWLARNEVRRRLIEPYVKLMFRWHGISWGHGWRMLGMPLIQKQRGSTIRLGDGLSLRSWPASNPLVPNHRVVLATRRKSAVIEVGHDCGFTGATLVAAEYIKLGDRVTLGSNVTIVDTDFHPLDPDERNRDFNRGRHAPVIIEDDVFVGMNSIILKGVTVGHGSVVGAGSVVTTNVPAGTIVAGNPARPIRPVRGA